MWTNASEAEWNTKAAAQLFHNNKESLEKLPNHKPREKKNRYREQLQYGQVNTWIQ